METGTLELKECLAVVAGNPATLCVGIAICISSSVSFCFLERALLFAFDVDLDVRWLHGDICTNVDLAEDLVAWVVVWSISFDVNLSALEFGA